jgi:condensin complex subunit 2
MEEISTSFCFICLLHLANEQGLRLQTDKEDCVDTTEDMEIDKKVGNIWGLKVCLNGDSMSRLLTTGIHSGV